jgi:hypothetical protein
MFENEERRQLTASELSELFKCSKFTAWANDLDRRAEEYVASERAGERGTRPTSDSPRNYPRYNR